MAKVSFALISAGSRVAALHWWQMFAVVTVWFS